MSKNKLQYEQSNQFLREIMDETNNTKGQYYDPYDDDDESDDEYDTRYDGGAEDFEMRPPIGDLDDEDIRFGGSAREAGNVMAFFITAVIIVAVIFLIYYCWQCYTSHKEKCQNTVLEEYIYVQPNYLPHHEQHSPHHEQHSPSHHSGVATHGARKNHHISKNKNFRSGSFHDMQA